MWTDCISMFATVEYRLSEMESSTMQWVGKRVVILGAARQGIALTRYLARHGALVVLNDQRTESDLPSNLGSLLDLDQRQSVPVKFVGGGHPLELLDGADLLCVSGGVPLNIPIVVEARLRGIPLSNDSQIFLEIAPCKVIGITGSAGKTTTTSILGRMAQAALDIYGEKSGFHRVWVGGNIGSPLISVVDDMEANDLAIMELSSFQLEIMSKSPEVAAVLNITPNHLDRHGTMEAYRSAKSRILEFQSKSDTAVLCREDPGSWGLKGNVRGDIVSFGISQAVLSSSATGELSHPVRGSFIDGQWLKLLDGENETEVIERSRIQLRGDHNLLNVLAACAIASAVGLPVDAMRRGIEGFQGVPHRLEFVREWGGAKWFNDSIATAPERAIAAINSFDEPLVLLAGGRDKDLPWEEFANLVQQRVDHLVLFGEAAEKIEMVLNARGRASLPYTLVRRKNLEGAIKAAVALVEQGDVVLLSPGGTSFDEFRDFEERGECFRRLIMQL